MANGRAKVIVNGNVNSCNMDELDVKAIESKKKMLNGTKCLK
jgi:hypothetical protein